MARDTIDMEVYEPGDVGCPVCGDTGVLDDECTCGQDTCCCLVPTPPDCPECKRRAQRD